MSANEVRLVVIPAAREVAMFTGEQSSDREVSNRAQRSCNCLVVWSTIGMANENPCAQENCFNEMFENANP